MHNSTYAWSKNPSALDALLQGVLDGARDATGARYGLICLFDEGDVAARWLTSGMSAEPADAMRELLSHLDDMARTEAGASDDAGQPLSPAELATRISAALGSTETLSATAPVQRPWDPTAQGRLELGDMVIDHVARLVRVSGRDVELAPIQYRLLAELAANVGTLLTHEHLVAAVWGPDSTADPNRLRTVIKDVRQRLGDDARNPRYIVTVPRVGYRMPSPEDA